MVFFALHAFTMKLHFLTSHDLKALSISENAKPFSALHTLEIVEIHRETILNSYRQADCLLLSYFTERIAWLTGIANSPCEFFQAMRDELSLADMELHMKI